MCGYGRETKCSINLANEERDYSSAVSYGLILGREAIYFFLYFTYHNYHVSDFRSRYMYSVQDTREKGESTIECMRYQSRISRFNAKLSSLVGSLLFYNRSKIVLCALANAYNVPRKYLSLTSRAPTENKLTENVRTRGSRSISGIRAR